MQPTDRKIIEKIVSLCKDTQPQIKSCCEFLIRFCDLSENITNYHDRIIDSQKDEFITSELKLITNLLLKEYLQKNKTPEYVNKDSIAARLLLDDQHATALFFNTHFFSLFTSTDETNENAISHYTGSFLYNTTEQKLVQALLLVCNYSKEKNIKETQKKITSFVDLALNFGATQKNISAILALIITLVLKEYDASTNNNMPTPKDIFFNASSTKDNKNFDFFYPLDIKIKEIVLANFLDWNITSDLDDNFFNFCAHQISPVLLEQVIKSNPFKDSQIAQRVQRLSSIAEKMTISSKINTANINVEKDFINKI